jgi:hypothetical protein
MDKIKVYKINECDWIASKDTLKNTCKWYNEEMEEADYDEVEECNLEKNGMWFNKSVTKDDIKRLGDDDEIFSIEFVNGMSKKVTSIGNLMRNDDDGEIYKFTSFKEVLSNYGKFEEPFIIATTEW